jgi:hypothetical protein
MLIVRWGGGDVTWISPENVVIEGLQKAPERALRRTAVDQVPEESDGALRMVEVTLKPGTAQHARAALRTLPDAVVLLDDGDT